MSTAIVPYISPHSPGYEAGFLAGLMMGMQLAAKATPAPAPRAETRKGSHNKSSQTQTAPSLNEQRRRRLQQEVERLAPEVAKMPKGKSIYDIRRASRDPIPPPRPFPLPPLGDDDPDSIISYARTTPKRRLTAEERIAQDDAQVVAVINGIRAKQGMAPL